MEEELAIRVIPAERSVMLLQVSKEMRTAMQRVSPLAMIKVKKGQLLERKTILTVQHVATSLKQLVGKQNFKCMTELVSAYCFPAINKTFLTKSVQSAMLDMMKWCRITAIDLTNTKIRAEGAGGLAVVLGQCASLAHLDLRGNRIGDEGAGRRSVVLGQCASLAHLDLGNNEIRDEGVVLEQCASLAHLNLCRNRIGAEGAGRLAVVLGQCASLAHLSLGGLDRS